VANIKKVSDAKIGDTITEQGRPTSEPLPGFKSSRRWCLRATRLKATSIRNARALEKLRLNDASFFYEPETSVALGFGFRCGFLGLLHCTSSRSGSSASSTWTWSPAPGVLPG
jgi:GTP-binding protein LepA